MKITRPDKTEADPGTGSLFEAIQELRSVEECRRFLLDLCTPAELAALSDRWKVARLLDQGIPYRGIQQMTGVSTATVTRVARALLHGESGYRLILNRLQSKGKSS